MRALEWLFRLALRAFPAYRRLELREEAVEAFRDGLRRRLADRGVLAAATYGGRSVVDAVVAGWAERAAGGAGIAAGVGGDVRYAIRRLRRAPELTAAAVLLVALGIGANAITFSAFWSVVVGSPPIRDADRVVLVRVRAVGPPPGDTVLEGWSYPELRELRDASGGFFQDVAGYAVRVAALSEPGAAERVRYELVTPGYFRALRVRPAAGRFFLPEEEGADGPVPVAVLSRALALERFGTPEAAVGRHVTVSGSRLRVVGVAESGFHGLTGNVRLWLPLGMGSPNLGSWTVQARSIPWLEVVARLAPAVTLPVASERAASVGRAIAEASAGPAEGGRTVDAAVTPLAELWTTPDTRRSIELATAAALLLLCIVGLNLAALLVARNRRDTTATAVHLALGAGRWRILRLRVVEATLLSGLGGATGVGLAGLLAPLVGGLVPVSALQGTDGYLQLLDDGMVAIDYGVAAAGVVAALLVGLLAGAVSAPAGERGGLAGPLRGARSTGGDVLGRSLLAGQVGLSVVLLVGAGLLLATIDRLHRQQGGFDPEGFVALDYSLVGRPAMASAHATRAFHRELRTRLAAIPEIRSVSLSSSPPLTGPFVTTSVEAVEGRPEPPNRSAAPLEVHVADHSYFGTVGASLRTGRSFVPEEDETAERLVVLNRTAAEAFFPDRPAVGGRIRFQAYGRETAMWWTVIGVVEDIRHGQPTEAVRPAAYIPLGVWAPPGLQALLRATPAAVPTVIRAARAALREVDPAVPFGRPRTGRDLRNAGVVGDTRAVGAPLTAFGLIALFLVAVGLWASVARAVSERRSEIGVRVALGARPGAVQRLLVTRLLAPVAAGGVLGLVGAAAGAGAYSHLLFGVESLEPVVFGGVALLLMVVAATAAWIPARRATRVDPVASLRAD